MKKLIYLFILGIVSQTLAFSQAGSVDSSFGVNGSIVYKDNVTVTGSLIQPDGKIVVTGYEAGIANAVMNRYNADGSVDNSFNFQPDITYQFSAAFGVRQLSDGKFIVFTVATDDMDNGPLYANIIKLNTDGSKDVSFNSPIITADVNNEYELFMGSDEKPGMIAFPGQSPNGEVNLIRFLNTGAYDQDFGPNGEKLITLFPNPPSPVTFEDKANAIISDDQGNFYFTFKVGNDFYISKTDADFNSFTTRSYNNLGRKYTFYANNSIYNAYNHNALQKFAASTLNPDNAYGTNSVAGGNTSGFDFRGNGGFVQSDGKGVVVSAYDNTNMYITRFLMDGSPDMDFGNNGVLDFTSDFPTGYNMSVHYSEPTGKLYIINVDEEAASFMITRVDLGEGPVTSISDVNAEKSFLIFPNPVTEYVYFPENSVEMTLMDMSGKTILKRKVSDEKLNLSDLDAGTYIIATKDRENKVHHQKIIKK